MTARTILGVLALACVSICGLAGGLMYFEIVDKVNERLPESERFAILWWHTGKYQRLHREYRKLYPEGRLIRRVRVITALMFVCLLISAWALGFFGTLFSQPSQH